jgi:hypothetical protein
MPGVTTHETVAPPVRLVTPSSRPAYAPPMLADRRLAFRTLLRSPGFTTLVCCLPATRVNPIEAIRAA